MALRMLELYVEGVSEKELLPILDLEGVTGYWPIDQKKKQWLLKALLDAEATESFTDTCSKKLRTAENFRIILLPVEGTYPREKEEEKAEDKTKKPGKEAKKVHRVSREELYHEVQEGTKLTPIFIIMVVLSSLVASIGMLRDNLAVIIGAMVIAPLLGPNVGLSLSTTLGDNELGKKSLLTNLIGLSIAFVLSLSMGIVLHVDPATPALAGRAEITLSDIVLAICAGVAGVLSFTSGVPSALIGVMVAVALLPPLVAVGLLLGSGNQHMALGAFLLLTTNIICINLAGTGTFLALGVAPQKWWEAKKARKATWRAIAAWAVSLAILALIIRFY